jgi:asparagine synthase (glutamine-hydrolysing)
MCGFVGCTGAFDTEAARNIAKNTVERMMERIVHRGPDMASTFLDNRVALGFRRLSIIDLSEAGSQPMSNSLEGDTVVVVFNGEIYNFKELRDELVALGHKFATNTDTEVIIHGYEQYGTEITGRLRGMFSFVLYDRRSGTLFGARDFFGIKPFYYTTLPDGCLLFGSEIKSFLEHPRFVKELNARALRPYLTFQYSVLDETFFKGVFKLPPAHRFTYKLSTKEMLIERYWDASFTPVQTGLDECVENLDQVVNESVEAHRIADVQVGTFLSGGIDSSYITSSMRPAKTFSIGFADEGFDETLWARELSELLGIENHRLLLDPADGFDAFADIQYHMDEPHADPSIVPLYFLAKLASEQVTVVLSGEGGDELFAGYELYDEPRPTRAYKRVVPGLVRRVLSTVAGRLPRFKGQGFLRRGSGRPEDYFIGQAHVFDEDEALRVLNPDYRCGPSVKEVVMPVYERVKDADELSKKQYLDLNLWMPGDILLKADKMSMAHSLELRVPFLDRVVMRTAAAIPPAYRVTEENTKLALRKAAARTIPAEWANRVKIGFLTPIRLWLKDERYYRRIRACFESDTAAQFFDRAQLLGLLDAHHIGAASNQRKVWTVYSFLVWYERFFSQEG